MPARIGSLLFTIFLLNKLKVRASWITIILIIYLKNVNIDIDELKLTFFSLLTISTSNYF